jgi:translation elongation factor EF-4
MRESLRKRAKQSKLVTVYIKSEEGKQQIKQLNSSSRTEKQLQAMQNWNNSEEGKQNARNASQWLKTERGKNHIEELHKAKIGIPCSESTKEKLRQANLGKKYSKESSEKKRQFMKKYWEDKKRLKALGIVRVPIILNS